VAYNRDEIHYETIMNSVSAYDYNKTSFEKVYDHTCELVLQLPAFRMSIDLGDGLLEHNHFLIPDSYMLDGFQTGSDDIREAGRW